MTNKFTEKMYNVTQGISQRVFVEKPCKVIKVYSSQYCVDVEYYSKNKKNVLLKVPIKHLQTQNAYVYLGVNIGDCGTVRFLDDDVSGYLEKSELESSEIRTHNINDSLFTLGFYPNSEHYLFPEGQLVIGTKNGCIIRLTDDNILISGGNIVLNSGNLTIGSNTTIDGKNFLAHCHSGGHDGNPTGGVI